LWGIISFISSSFILFLPLFYLFWIVSISFSSCDPCYVWVVELRCIIVRFVIPVVFINKLHWSVYICLTQFYLMVEICIEFTTWRTTTCFGTWQWLYTAHISWVYLHTMFFHFSTWRWPLSSAETCSCSLCSIFYTYLYHLYYFENIQHTSFNIYVFKTVLHNTVC